MTERTEWTEWGVRWTSPFGSHVTVEESRTAARDNGPGEAAPGRLLLAVGAA